LPEERAFSHLVVIGSSAGGIEALSELVSTLPERFSARPISGNDGRGFDTAGAGSERLGLRSMRERAAHLDGEFHLASEPGIGTRVVVSIPSRGSDNGG